MTPKELADQIREVHRICEESTISDDGERIKYRPRWGRFIRTSYGLIGLAVVLGWISLLAQLGLENARVAGFAVVSMWAGAGVTGIYALGAAVLDVLAVVKSVKDFASPFSRSDSDSLAESLDALSNLAKLNHAAVSFVANAMEAKGKQVENARTFLTGSAILVAGVFGGLVAPGSPLRIQVAKMLPEVLLPWIQVWLYAGLIGMLIALVASWRLSVACTNRGIFLRRILTDRELLLGMRDTAEEIGK